MTLPALALGALSLRAASDSPVALTSSAGAGVVAYSVTGSLMITSSLFVVSTLILIWLIPFKGPF